MPSVLPTGYAVLRNRSYRLFWLGQWVSLIGTWMQTVTLAWLLNRLTGGDPFALGMLGAASAAPTLILVLIGGVVSDRVDRRRLIIGTQFLSLLQASALAALTLGGVVQPWHIIALATVLGAVNAFDIPARQAFVVELVGRTDLPSAIALNATGFNVARVAGPAFGGLLVAGFGEGICFLLNAVSYVAVLWGLWLIPERREGAAPPAPSEARAIWAGVRHAWRHEELRSILLVVGVVSSVGVSYRNFLPAMAHTVLGVGAWRYGLLMAATGVGAGVGAFVLAGLRLPAHRYRYLLPVGLVGFSLALGGFSASRDYGWSLALLALVGAGGIAFFNASHVLLQLTVDDVYRGRVMSLYVLMHQGTATFGSLALGAIAARSGTPAALLAGALFCSAAAVWCVSAVVRRRAVSVG